MAVVIIGGTDGVIKIEERAVRLRNRVHHLKPNNMRDIKSSAFGQLAEKIAIPVNFLCYETMGDISNAVMRAYIHGQIEENIKLTKWHDAKEELPKEDVEVLCMIHRRFQTYAILRYDVNGWWQPVVPTSAIPDGGWIAFDGEIIAWREIHEK